MPEASAMTAPNHHKSLGENDLSPDQKAVFSKVMRWKRDQKGQQVLTLGGFAGTGKSTLVSILAQDDSTFHRIAFCALTGKAAGVLRRKLQVAEVDLGKHTCSTIHGLIYTPNTDPVTGQVLGYKRRQKLECDLIIIDEASMVPGDIFEDVTSYGVPILAVGDHGQLPPVKSNFKLMQSPDLRLEQIHRQAAENPIIRLSAEVRATGLLPRNFHDGKHVRFVPKNEFHAEMAIRYKGKKAAELFDVAVLTYTNRARTRVNDIIRAARFGKTPNGPIVDDQLICLKNAYLGKKGELPIFNGMRGIVESIRPTSKSYLVDTSMRMPEEDVNFTAEMCVPQFGREKTFASLEEFSTFGFTPGHWSHCGLMFDYGSALTVHKAQGSAFSDLVVCYERPSVVPPDEYKRWLYTAVTRAADVLTIVGAP